MQRTKRLSKMLLALLAISVVGAVSASSAMALSWYPGSDVFKLSGSLTFSSAGLPTGSCAMPSETWGNHNTSTGELVFASISSNDFYLPCGASMRMVMKPLSTTTFRLGREKEAPLEKTPWGVQYVQNIYPVGDFAVGTSSTNPSTIKFENDAIGTTTLGNPVYISGTLKLYTYSGQVVKILP